MNKEENSLPANDFEAYESGFVQRREWMLYKIRPDHYPFNIPVIIELDMFERNLFQNVINLIVKKHEILRTTLKVIDKKLMQIVHRAENFPVNFTLLDLTKKNEENKKSFIEKTKIVQCALPFNFEYGPLFRITVFAKGEQQYEVLIVFHHVIFDARSVEIFKKDAAELWNMEIGESPPVVFDRKAQYRKYTAFENELLNTPLGDEYREYWKNQLIKKIQRLQLIDENNWDLHLSNLVQKVKEVKNKIFDLPYYDERFIASVIRRYRGENAGVLNYFYNSKTFEHILEFRENSNNSLFSLFIASFLLTFNKLSGQENFVFDIPASRKIVADYKHIIGWLLAGGICSFDINENKNISIFLDYVDKQLYLLSSHCIYPFEALGQESDDIPVGSNLPIFLTLTEMQDFPGANVQRKGIANHEFESTLCYQDIAIFLYLSNNSCSVEIVYNNFLISPKIIEKLVCEQEIAINSIVENVFTQKL